MRNKLEDTFEKFIKDFDMNDKQVSFRYRHSYRVKKLMKELSMKLGLSSKEVELAIEKFFNIVIPNEESKEELNKLKESMILYINNRIETNK